MRILPRGPRESPGRRIADGLRGALHPPRTPLEFMAAVVLAERENQTKRAVRICDRGLNRHPDDFYLLMKRLSYARLAGDRSLAESLIALAEPLVPESAATFSSLGEEFAVLGDLPRAESYFRRALERTPGNPLLREKLAMSLVQQRKFEEGVSELRTASDAEPENTERRDLLLKVLLHAERFADVVEMLQAIPEESLSWDSLMCLSVARARLDGASDTAGMLLHPHATEADPEPDPELNREDLSEAVSPAVAAAGAGGAGK